MVGSHYRGIPSSLHKIRLLDSKGASHTITVATVSSITVCSSSPGLSPIRNLFPKAEPEVYDRPEENVDLLLGSYSRALLPRGIITMVGDLALEATPLACGQLLRGSHHLLGGDRGQGLSLEATTLSTCLLTLPQGATAFTSISII